MRFPAHTETPTITTSVVRAVATDASSSCPSANPVKRRTPPSTRLKPSSTSNTPATSGGKKVRRRGSSRDRAMTTRADRINPPAAAPRPKWVAAAMNADMLMRLGLCTIRCPELMRVVRLCKNVVMPMTTTSSAMKPRSSAPDRPTSRPTMTVYITSIKALKVCVAPTASVVPRSGVSCATYDMSRGFARLGGCPRMGTDRFVAAKPALPPSMAVVASDVGPRRISCSNEANIGHI